MSAFLEMLDKWHVINIFYAIFLILIGYVIGKIVSANVHKIFRKRLSSHVAILIQRFAFYIILAIFIVCAVDELGFHIGALLGAAGILTAAIGFASQTSISNIISGLFIIGEKPFTVGDSIKVNDIQGRVYSLGWLSIQIRTNDNTLVRVPNELLIKSPITNFSHYPSRRADLLFTISHQENIAEIRKMLLSIIKDHPLCLKEPEASLHIESFSESLVKLRLSVWADQANFDSMKNKIQEEMHRVFEKHQIRMAKQFIYLTESIKHSKG